MHIATYFRFPALLLITSILHACSLHSTHLTSVPEKGLEPILSAYRQTVRHAHENDQYSWNNGRIGNIFVNMDAENQRGLCFHWQKLVYIGIQDALTATGWRASGIAINEGSFFEHHAVLIYDPGQIKFYDILNNTDKSTLYVLDPWSSGEPRIYRLKDWLALPVTHILPARLTTVDTRPHYPASL